LRSVGTSWNRWILAGLILATCAAVALVVEPRLHAAPARSTTRGPALAGPTTGPTIGTAATSPSAGNVVVGLGDSVMAGTACGCDGPVAAYARLMSKSLGRHITPVNMGVGGATTSSLQAQLKQSSTRSAVASASVVLVIIGANDLLPQLARYRSSECTYTCYQPAVVNMSGRLNDLLDQIADLRDGRRGTVLVTDYWNVFPDGTSEREQHGAGEAAWGRQVSRAANAEICRVSRENGAVCVDTYAPFLAHGGDPDRYLAADGDHPNAAGVDLIAAQLQKATPKGAL